MENISFRSEMKTGELTVLWLGNIILMVITLGLATPWVMVRNARYRISKTSVIGENLTHLLPAMKIKFLRWEMKLEKTLIMAI